MNELLCDSNTPPYRVPCMCTNHVPFLHVPNTSCPISSSLHLSLHLSLFTFLSLHPVDMLVLRSLAYHALIAAFLWVITAPKALKRARAHVR